VLVICWWGFTSAADLQCIEAVLRRGIRSGLCSSEVPTISKLFECSDDKLFANILYNQFHVLYNSLPAETVLPYNFRCKPNNRQLINKTSRLADAASAMPVLLCVCCIKTHILIGVPFIRYYEHDAFCRYVNKSTCYVQSIEHEHQMKWLSVFSWFTYCYFLLHSWHLIVLGNIFCSWISPKIHVHWCAAVLTWRRIQFMPLMLFDLLHVFIYILIDLFIGCGRRWSTVWLEKWWSLSNCLSLTVTRRRAFSKRFFDFSFREHMSPSYCLPEFFRHFVAHKTVHHKFSYRQWCKSILVSVGRAPTSATEPSVQLDFESRLSADGPQTSRLVMRTFQTVAEDIWSVGPMRSVILCMCALEMLLLTNLLTFRLRSYLSYIVSGGG